MNILSFSLLIIGLLPLGACMHQDKAKRASEAVAVKIGNLKNTYLYTKDVYGGSGPYREADFEALHALEIELIVSVDGAQPQLELAKKYGIRYVHIPISYNGVEAQAQAQLVKTFQQRKGPMYVHCHQGKHRGPAASMSLLIGAGVLNNKNALRILKQVGTSKNYTGLYRDVKNAQRLNVETIKNTPALQEYTKVSDLTASMVQIELVWDHLRLAQQAGWGVPKDHPDIDPAHEALMLHELFVELKRQDQAQQLNAEEARTLGKFKTFLQQSVDQSRTFEYAIRQKASASVIETNFTHLKQSCYDCHQEFRDY